jgi:hypothetical protein
VGVSRGTDLKVRCFKGPVFRRSVVFKGPVASENLFCRSVATFDRGRPSYAPKVLLLET